jgi:hypothetical protein
VTRALVRRALTLAVCVGLAGCESVDPRELPGTYYYHGKSLADAITIRPDHTYEHVIAPPDGQTIHEEGTWELEIIDGRSYVTFANFRFYSWEVDEPKPPDVPGFWPALIERSSDGLHLVVSLDLDTYYGPR